MTVRHDLAVPPEPLEPVGLQDRRIIFQVLQDLRLEDHEPAIDPALADLGLLGELLHAVPVEDEPAEARRRAYSRDRRELAMRAMEGGERLQVDARDAVAV